MDDMVLEMEEEEEEGCFGFGFGVFRSFELGCIYRACMLWLGSL